jgi:N-acetylglucosaminyldiphosphoundecaprenol N-acetyl-beta-D-mannosaminyltransferase
VISHLGAVLNFVAGTVIRAPLWVQRCGLEWLWRIKQEPVLWRRYFTDGLVFLRLLTTRVLPYSWFIFIYRPNILELETAGYELLANGTEVAISLRGAWTQENLRCLRECFSDPALAGKDVRLEMAEVTYVDSAFIGLLMLLYGSRKRQGRHLIVVRLTKRVRQIFRYACADFLLDLR